MRNKITLDMMDPSGYDCKYIISESDGTNTLQLYMWSVGTNPIIHFQWTNPDGSGEGVNDTTGYFLDTGEFYYSANPEIFTANRLITMWVTWDGDQSKNIYFQCVNLTADTNYTVTRDLSGDDLYRVAAATDDTLPIATTTSTGVVQIGTGLNINETGVISTPIASKEALGIVKIGDGIDVADGTISLAPATAENIGGMKPGERMEFTTDGTIDVPLASTEFPGVVKIGEGLAFDADGKLTVNLDQNLNAYTVLSNSSVKLNNKTYTFNKNSDGQIVSASNSDGFYFTPTWASGVTDMTLHNAVFMAVTMLTKINTAKPANDWWHYHIDDFEPTTSRTLSFTVGAIGKALLVVVHRDAITISDSGWELLAETPAIKCGDIIQQISIYQYSGLLEFGSDYSVTVTQASSNRIFTSISIFSNANDFVVVDNTVSPTSPFTPPKKTGNKRLYIASVIWAGNNHVPGVSSYTGSDLVIYNSVQRITICYDYKPELMITPTFSANDNEHPNDLNCITLDVI